MKRTLQGHYVSAATAGEAIKAFVPKPLTPRPAIDWTPALLTPATVNKSLAHLERIRVVAELARKQRGRVFSYARNADILNEGMALPGGPR